MIFLLITTIYSFALNSVAERGYRWKNFPIEMQINSDNADLPHSEVYNIISLAMKSWNTASNMTLLSAQLEKSSMSSANTMDLNGKSSISFSKDFFSDSHGFDPDIVVAVGGQYGQSGVMSDGFVVFNSESVVWETDNYRKTSSEYIDDLQTIAVHELGHVLGLGHSESRDAVMNAHRITRIRRILSQDDIDGITYLTTTQSSMGSSKGAGCGYIESNNTNTNKYIVFLLFAPIITLLCFRIKITKNL